MAISPQRRCRCAPTSGSERARNLDAEDILDDANGALFFGISHSTTPPQSHNIRLASSGADPHANAGVTPPTPNCIRYMGGNHAPFLGHTACVPWLIPQLRNCCCAAGIAFISEIKC